MTGSLTRNPFALAFRGETDRDALREQTARAYPGPYPVPYPVPYPCATLKCYPQKVPKCYPRATPRRTWRCCCSSGIRCGTRGMRPSWGARIRAPESAPQIVACALHAWSPLPEKWKKTSLRLCEKSRFAVAACAGRTALRSGLL